MNRPPSRPSAKALEVPDSAAGSAVPPSAVTGALPPAEPRPWGIWVSLALYVLIFEAEWRLYDVLLDATGLGNLLRDHPVLHGVNNIVAWGIQFLIIVIAVRLTRIPLRDYLGWNRPRAVDVALGVALVVAYYVAFAFFLAAIGQIAPAIQDYRSTIAAGTPPWWFVLEYWPAILLAPFVEESFFRGFLWRGVQFRFGNAAAFVLTTALFVAMHYEYWMRGGVFDPGAFLVQYVIPSSIFGALRWRSGGTTVCIIAHALDNAGLRLMIVVLSAMSA
jgi:membrane protease YdiL (CAAX protease family)